MFKWAVVDDENLWEARATVAHVGKHTKDHEDAPSGDIVRMCKEKKYVHLTAYTNYWKQIINQG